MNNTPIPIGLRSSLLSEREREVLFLAAEGMTDKEIAVSLGIGPKTVRTYWDRMRAKLGAASRTQALAMALRAAYEELAEREARFHSFVDRLPAFFVSLDELGHIEYVNAATRQALGTINQPETPDQMLATLIEDDSIREEVREAWVNRRTDTSGVVVDVRTATGGPRKVAWYGHQEGEAPLGGHYLAVGVDVTDQAAPDSSGGDLAALKLLVESSEQAVWLLTPDFQTKFVNQAMAHLLGSTRERLQNETPINYIGKEDLDAALAFIKAGGGANVPFRFLRCDGTFIPVRKTLCPVLTNGAIVGYLIVASERFAK